MKTNNGGNNDSQSTTERQNVLRIESKELRRRQLLSDKTCLETVRKMISRQELATARDFYFASVVMERGMTTSDYALAYLLALQANNMGYNNIFKTPHPLDIAKKALNKWLETVGISKGSVVASTTTETASDAGSKTAARTTLVINTAINMSGI